MTLTVAFQGEHGAYSEQAALALFAGCDALPCASFDEVFVAVEAGRYERGCGLTEIRSGTYCLNDYNQVHLQSCTRAQNRV